MAPPSALDRSRVSNQTPIKWAADVTETSTPSRRAVAGQQGRPTADDSETPNRNFARPHSACRSIDRSVNRRSGSCITRPIGQRDWRRVPPDRLRGNDRPTDRWPRANRAGNHSINNNKSMDRPIARYIGRVKAMMTGSPIDRPIDRRSDGRLADRPTKRLSSRRSTDRFAYRSTSRPRKRWSTRRSTDLLADRPPKRSQGADRSIDLPTDRRSDQGLADRSMYRLIDRPKESTSRRSIYRPIDQPIDRTTDPSIDSRQKDRSTYRSTDRSIGFPPHTRPKHAHNRTTPDSPLSSSSSSSRSPCDVYFQKAPTRFCASDTA